MLWLAPACQLLQNNYASKLRREYNRNKGGVLNTFLWSNSSPLEVRSATKPWRLYR